MEAQTRDYRDIWQTSVSKVVGSCLDYGVRILQETHFFLFDLRSIKALSYIHPPVNGTDLYPM
jgi:hypothetical protein